ncbi:AAA family ATPase [Anaerolinea sp.]|uniref:AAA family ATPase n=1 Tax=Anaerolinea sp. TaxID=1872519 RepID=UPI002ACD5F15|nr:AAA family ATPase [Anaerolinea sp.]
MLAKDTWFNETHTLQEALKPRPPISYAVDGLLMLPSLVIVYGAPGVLKSLLLADLAVCTAAGREWLPPLPHDRSGAVQPIRTTACPVLWLDFDNGVRRTASRLAALAKGHSAESAPLFYLSTPSVPFNAGSLTSSTEMAEYIRDLGAKVVFIDNLLAISGARDENSPEVFAVMIGLRMIAERTGAAIVVIHHSRKQNGIRGGLGDDLRGHSSIRGAVDLALLVERENSADVVMVKPTKSRDLPVEPFGAIFAYTHKPGSTDLETAGFFGLKVGGGEETTAEVESLILDALRSAKGPVTQSELITLVKSKGVRVGVNRIRAIAARMANEMRLKTQVGSHGAIYYHV